MQEWLVFEIRNAALARVSSSQRTISVNGRCRRPNCLEGTTWYRLPSWHTARNVSGDCGPTTSPPDSICACLITSKAEYQQQSFVPLFTEMRVLMVTDNHRHCQRSIWLPGAQITRRLIAAGQGSTHAKQITRSRMIPRPENSSGSAEFSMIPLARAAQFWKAQRFCTTRTGFVFLTETKHLNKPSEIRADYFRREACRNRRIVHVSIANPFRRSPLCYYPEKRRSNAPSSIAGFRTHSSPQRFCSALATILIQQHRLVFASVFPISSPVPDSAIAACSRGTWKDWRPASIAWSAARFHDRRRRRRGSLHLLRKSWRKIGRRDWSHAKIIRVAGDFLRRMLSRPWMGNGDVVLTDEELDGLRQICCGPKLPALCPTASANG